jgi:hypothetical protein
MLIHSHVKIEISPASSVDAECAFSGGCLQVGHLQHGTSSQTFKARVALSSWANTPLLPDDVAIKILQDATQKNKPKKKLECQESEEVVSVTSGTDSDTE